MNKQKPKNHRHQSPNGRNWNWPGVKFNDKNKPKRMSVEDMYAAFAQICEPLAPGEVRVSDPCDCGKPSVIKIVVEQQSYLNSLRRNSDGEWIREHRQWVDDDYRDSEFFCEPCYEAIKDFIFRFQG